MPKLKLHWQILIALGLAFLVGAALDDQTRLLGVHFYGLFEFVGTIFLNALKMIVVPLVVSSITVGVASIGSGGSIGRLGAKTLGYYLVTSLLAILLALAWAREFRLRRALQALLARIFTFWRTAHETDSANSPRDDQRDPVDARRSRMR